MHRPAIASKGARMSKPRLRFDKVALRLIADLQAALRDDVPEGKTVLFTVTAPIRLPAKTVAELVPRIRPLLKSGRARAELAETLNGNQVRVRVVTGRAKRAPNVLGFVHNP